MAKVLTGILAFVLTVAILAGGTYLFAASIDFSSVSDAMDRMGEKNTPNDSETDTETETGTGSETETGTGSETETGTGSETETGTDSETESVSVKEKLDTLVDNYNEANHELLIGTFRNYIEGLYEPNDTTKSAYYEVVDCYVANLMNGIGEESARQQAGEGSTFTEAEAKAFDTYIGFLGGMLTEETPSAPTEQEVFEMLDAAVESDACFKTLVEITEDETVKESCSEAFSRTEQANQESFVNALKEYAEAMPDDERRAQVCEQTAALLGITWTE